VTLPRSGTVSRWPVPLPARLDSSLRSLYSPDAPPAHTAAPRPLAVLAAHAGPLVRLCAPVAPLAGLDLLPAVPPTLPAAEAALAGGAPCAVPAPGVQSGARWQPDGLLVTSCTLGAVVVSRVPRLSPAVARGLAPPAAPGTAALTPVHRWAFSMSPGVFLGALAAGPAADSLAWVPAAVQVLAPTGPFEVHIPQHVAAGVAAFKGAVCARACVHVCGFVRVCARACLRVCGQGRVSGTCL
jgi:hypothetical protein